MTPSLSTNAAQIAARMKARRAAVVAELAKAARVAAPMLNRAAKEILRAEVYDVPIPLLASASRETDLSRVPAGLRARVLQQRAYAAPLSEKEKAGLFHSSRQTKGGRAFRKWRRSGALLANERAKVDGPSVVAFNTQKYAAARAALGQSAALNPSGRKAGIQRDQGKLPAEERSMTRPVQWQHEAVQRVLPQVRELRRKAVLTALRIQ